MQVGIEKNIKLLLLKLGIIKEVHEEDCGELIEIIEEVEIKQ